jgi:UDP-glucose 4-epimerase
MRRPSASLMAEVFPDVPIRGSVDGRASLLSTEHAAQALGWRAEHSWLAPTDT